MFIDYVALMLLNMAAGFVVLAAFLMAGLPRAERKGWAASFAMVGLVALACGFHMIFTWPLPGSYNSAFGEMSVLLGAAYLGIALSVGKEWSVAPMAIYGVFAGGAAALVGVRIMRLGMTAQPVLSGIGFILSGAGGILAALAFCAPRSRFLRLMGAFVLVAAALLWAATAYPAYWMHMDSFSSWKRSPAPVAAEE